MIDAYYSKDEMLLACKQWFEDHCSQAALADGLGFAEHPMLTAIKLTLELTGVADRPSRIKPRYFVAESVNGTPRWIADLSECLPIISDREKALRERVADLEACLRSIHDTARSHSSGPAEPDVLWDIHQDAIAHL